jgi:hypothetical protein
LERLHTYWTGRVKTMDRLHAATREDLDRAGRRVEELEGILQEKIAALHRVARDLGVAESRVAELQQERYELARQPDRCTSREHHRLEVQPIHLDLRVAETEGHTKDQRNGPTNGHRDPPAPEGNGQTDAGAPVANNLGISTFEQIAEWTPEDVHRIAERIKGSHGRIARDHWVGQAQRLARQKT